MYYMVKCSNCLILFYLHHFFNKITVFKQFIKFSKYHKFQAIFCYFRIVLSPNGHPSLKILSFWSPR